MYVGMFCDDKFIDSPYQRNLWRVLEQVASSLLAGDGAVGLTNQRLGQPAFQSQADDSGAKR